MSREFNITSLFGAAAKANPDKAAIVYEERTITFGELHRNVEDTARYFRSKGIGKGDRVLIFVPMSIDLYRIVLALFSIGATAVFLDEWVSRKRLQLCAEIASCKAFIGSRKIRFLALFFGELRRIPVKLGVSYSANVPALPIEKTTAEDTALITFTTGSTGKPKAAKRTHGFLEKQFDALIRIIDPQPDDVDMPVLPIVLLINLGAGSTSVIADFKSKKPGTLDVGKTLNAIRKHNVTRIVASPYFVLRLASSGVQHIPSLREIFTGGAPVFPTEARTLSEAFPEARIEIVYGSTEAEPISAIDANELKLESPGKSGGLNVGKPDSSATVRIIRTVKGEIAPQTGKEFDDLQLPQGEIGEIIVSGEHVLREYFNNEEALRLNKIWLNGDCWHRTGDSGFFDASGNLHLTGRCANLVYRNNRILSPFIYENELRGIKGIAAGTLLELAGKLVLVAESKLTESELREKLAHSGLLFDEVKILLSIPRDPRHNSKIDYDKLKNTLHQA